ncbi:MAG: hypothetical protein KKC75_08475 [Nanoarchaeota archaeon]|nr:hypothetical protein [Nanoarchaeota archaeon]MBU1005394.1 hypothetical protein [Nanoarchaeota archaeon]MBU1945676.1 hypothetical protein [Nanoarchaeota archaeon]
MIIKAIKIEPETIIKIFDKHNVLQEEIFDVLKNDDPRFKKVGGNQYAAIGLSKSRYLTIFFRYDEGEAEITTAYPSDKNQIRSYKKVK